MKQKRAITRCRWSLSLPNLCVLIDPFRYVRRAEERKDCQRKLRVRRAEERKDCQRKLRVRRAEERKDCQRMLWVGFPVFPALLARAHSVGSAR